ncbi:MAG: formate dehydrogenase accessory sulfurtransferase FdhD [Pyrinomonadaceae bacterium]
MKTAQPVSQAETAVTASDGRRFSDVLAVEEPLEIRLAFSEAGKPVHRAISITMRTPGHDGELAAGFLFTEGILSSPDQVKQIRHCGLKIRKAKGVIERVSALNSNTIRVELADGVSVDIKKLERHFYTSSSCGVCGKSSIEALRSNIEKLAEDGFSISPDVVCSLTDKALAEQDAFAKTGGLHASALFSAGGELELIREDVGRHNALDKVIGAKFLDRAMPLSDKILLVSGRASFELVQKALVAGIPIMAAIGAPSSLAVELAREYGMTLIGFLRDGRYNVYSGEQRLAARSSALRAAADAQM